MKEEKSATEIFLPVKDYDLAATLDSGQVFRWRERDGAWFGVVDNRQVRLKQADGGIFAQTVAPVGNWDWLREFLQTNVDLEKILKTFPNDEPMNQAVTACRGLRVLRQDPWECLASFILSSTKQIVQIRQIVAQLCSCFGGRLVAGPCEPAECSNANNSPSPLPSPAGRGRIERRRLETSADWSSSTDLGHAFPRAERIAGLAEVELRSCKMGFRAPNLLGAARQMAEGKLDLERLRGLPYHEARAELMKLRGVGGKIADCVLLFAYGFDSAFPVDVWVERALQTLYFPRRRAKENKLLHFAATHFGPHAGYAQQYLFHYMRIKRGRR